MSEPAGPFGELREILALLSRMLGVTTTFFDSRAHELRGLRMRGLSPFCAACRADPAFDRACRACDQQHLKAAKTRRATLIYTCHAGLVEGIVPLYGRDGFYLGALMFGQLRDPGRRRPAGVPARGRELWRAVRTCTPARAADIGRLLKYVSEYIIRQELVRVRHEAWAETLQRHVEANLAGRITLRDLGSLLGRSPSFVTHHFAAEFGTTPRQFVLARKMDKARELLASGLQVQEVAARLGFYDAFHFSKRFKTHWGRPPSAFRA